MRLWPNTANKAHDVTISTRSQYSTLEAINYYWFYSTDPSRYYHVPDTVHVCLPVCCLSFYSIGPAIESVQQRETQLVDGGGGGKRPSLNNAKRLGSLNR